MTLIELITGGLKTEDENYRIEVVVAIVEKTIKTTFNYLNLFASLATRFVIAVEQKVALDREDCNFWKRMK